MPHSIVAVPGLGADPKSSFISEGSSKFDWLKDEKEGILSDIKTARVLKYQYDSRWLGDKALKQTLNNVADLFLDSLVDKRKGHDTRPIMFVAHSLGGLVVAKALTLAISHPEKIDRMRIYECFAGGIFFGTPFGGSTKVGSGIMLASFLKTIKEAIPNQMMQVLDPERDSLTELRRDFAQLVKKEPSASIACIYEQKDTNYIKVLGDRVPKLMVCEYVNKTTWTARGNTDFFISALRALSSPRLRRLWMVQMQFGAWLAIIDSSIGSTAGKTVDSRASKSF